MDAITRFHEGTLYDAYNFFGAHTEGDTCVFRVWAPAAEAVSVVGDFNGWSPSAHPMQPIGGGVWEATVCPVRRFDCYKFALQTAAGEWLYRADPYAFYSEKRPGTASRLYHTDRRVADGRYRPGVPYDAPMAIYELHAGSWRKNPDGSFYTYRQLADELAPYLKAHGFTHVELLPVAEHPLDASWGYQITGFYSVTSRYGTPEDFMYFVETMHRHKIGVLMDWVSAHFPRDAQGLRLFDGTPLYEYADPRKGEHKQWGTMVFDYGKGEVQSFLISNALFWLEVFHLDGLRVDAVSSMLYLDYGRPPGQWIPNRYGGNGNLEAVAFLQKLNTAVFARFPNAIMAAEESTAWPAVTKPVHDGGLGFNFKWNMGWMNDVLAYFSQPTWARRTCHDKLTFSLFYAFSENFILPLSHDEVVHGKGSLMGKMPGTYAEKFAGLRTLYAYYFAHPGKKLLFMGGEFGQFAEWNEAKPLDWHLLDYPAHAQFAAFSAALVQFYRAQRSLWQLDSGWEGFAWVNADDAERSIVSFMRYGKRRGERLLVVCNFTTADYPDFSVGVPRPGVYEEVFSTDSTAFGGSGITCGEMRAEKSLCDGLPYRITFHLPPLTAVFIKAKPNKKHKM